MKIGGCTISFQHYRCYAESTVCHSKPKTMLPIPLLCATLQQVMDSCTGSAVASVIQSASHFLKLNLLLLRAWIVQNHINTIALKNSGLPIFRASRSNFVGSRYIHCETKTQTTKLSYLIIGP